MDKIVNELLGKVNARNQLSEELLMDISDKNNIDTIDFMKICDLLCEKGIVIVPEKNLESNNAAGKPEEKQSQIDSLFLSLSLPEQYDCISRLLAIIKDKEVVSNVKRENAQEDGTALTEFMKSLRSSNSRYSYTYVLIKSFLLSANNYGEAKLDDIIDSFISYYKNRYVNGLKVEQHNSKLIKQGIDYNTVRFIILNVPLMKSYLKNYLFYDKKTISIKMIPDLWLNLNDELKKEIIECADMQLDKYYAEL